MTQATKSGRDHWSWVGTAGECGPGSGSPHLGLGEELERKAPGPSWFLSICPFLHFPAPHGATGLIRGWTPVGSGLPPSVCQALCLSFTKCDMGAWHQVGWWLASGQHRGGQALGKGVRREARKSWGSLGCVPTLH